MIQPSTISTVVYQAPYLRYREYNTLQEKQSPSSPSPDMPEVKQLFQEEVPSLAGSFLFLKPKLHALSANAQLPKWNGISTLSSKNQSKWMTMRLQLEDVKYQWSMRNILTAHTWLGWGLNARDLVEGHLRAWHSTGSPSTSSSSISWPTFSLYLEKSGSEGLLRSSVLGPLGRLPHCFLPQVHHLSNPKHLNYTNNYGKTTWSQWFSNFIECIASVRKAF